MNCPLLSPPMDSVGQGVARGVLKFKGVLDMTPSCTFGRAMVRDVAAVDRAAMYLLAPSNTNTLSLLVQGKLRTISSKVHGGRRRGAC